MRIVMRDRSGGGGHWKLVESKDYGQEVNMHALLAESPSLIPTDELPGTPSPFVVAVREFDLPGSGSTDIVLFNPEGNIAVVECKLAYNVQIKREVIGQILEYASYLWRMSYAEVDARVRRQHPEGLAEAMAKAVSGGNWDEESFRRAVQSTLDTGAFNLIIAVDEINEELSRTIGFLNGCGNPAFTFHALALPRFQSDQVEILVPDLHGPIGESKQAPPRNRWTEERFQAEVEKLQAEVGVVVRNLHEWIRELTGSVRFGTGIGLGSSSLYCQAASREVRIFTTYTSGVLEMAYGSLIDAGLQPVADSLNADLRRLSGFGRLPAHAAKYPSVSIQEAIVDHPENLEKFKAAVLEAMATIRLRQAGQQDA